MILTQSHAQIIRFIFAFGSLKSSTLLLFTTKRSLNYLHLHNFISFRKGRYRLTKRGLAFAVKMENQLKKLSSIQSQGHKDLIAESILAFSNLKPEDVYLEKRIRYSFNRYIFADAYIACASRKIVIEAEYSKKCSRKLIAKIKVYEEMLKEKKIDRVIYAFSSRSVANYFMKQMQPPLVSRIEVVLIGVD